MRISLGINGKSVTVCDERWCLCAMCLKTQESLGSLTEHKGGKFLKKLYSMIIRNYQLS